MKNYVANTTVNFEGYRFYVRQGDMLAHDPQHGNSLAIYRNGQLVKVIRVDSLVIEAFLKSKFITEVRPRLAKKPPMLPRANARCWKDLPPGPVGAEGIPTFPLERPMETTTKLAKKQADAFSSNAGIAMVKGKAKSGPVGGLADRFGNPVDDLGNTPAGQAQQDSLAQQADEAMERGVPQFPKPDGKRPKAKEDVSFSEPSPSQIPGPSEVQKKPRQAKITEPFPEPPPPQIPGPPELPRKPQQSRIAEP
jgi:hypothetical protein